MSIINQPRLSPTHPMDSSDHSSEIAQRTSADAISLSKGLKRRSGEGLRQHSPHNPALMMPPVPRPQPSQTLHYPRPAVPSAAAVPGCIAPVTTATPLYQHQRRLQALRATQPVQAPPFDSPPRQGNAKRHAHARGPTASTQTGVAIGAASAAGAPRRIMANRQSAARSKERRRGYVIGLEQDVKELTAQVSQQQEHLHALATSSTDLGDCAPSSLACPVLSLNLPYLTITAGCGQRKYTLCCRIFPVRACLLSLTTAARSCAAPGKMCAFLP